VNPGAPERPGRRGSGDSADRAPSAAEHAGAPRCPQCLAQQRRNEHLKRVLHLQSAINAGALRSASRDELLSEVCRLATTIGPYDRATICLVRADGQTAEVRFHLGHPAPRYPTIEIGTGNAPDKSLTGRALRTGIVALSRDLTRPEPPVLERGELLAQGVRTIVALPLTVEGRQVGALTLSSHEEDALSEDDLPVLADVATNLSFALHLQQHATAVAYLSHYDSLTGLANRPLFCSRLDEQLRRGLPLGNLLVAAFDVTNLNQINDSLGRACGDQLLQQIAERLRDYAGNEQRCGYLGGGSFALLEMGLPRGSGDVVALLDSTVFARPFTIEGRTLRVAWRAGASRFPANGTDGGTLLQKAEAALQYAKDCGEQYLTYKIAMRSEVVERLTLEHQLREAVEAQQFELYYQPQVNVTTGRIEALEALLRWNHPEEGLLLPARFLTVLESSGLIIPVGEWALRRALRDQGHWHELGLGPVRVAVNVSPLQVRRRTFVEELLGIERSGACALDLEITETALMQDLQGISRRLQMLRDAGIRIALDDFGTGYSSLGLLSKLPVDLLKIDRRFVRNLPSDPASVTLTRTVIGLASGFGLLTVAEGVETEAQLRVLRRFGCDYSQGYLHARPLPARAVQKLLSRQPPARR